MSEVSVTIQNQSIRVTTKNERIYIRTLQTNTLQTINVGGGGGSGDVTGPANSTDDHLVLFNGVTGKIIKDIGISPAALESIRRNAANNGWEAFAPAAALGYTPPRILYINTVADSFTGSAAETLRPNYSFTIAGGTLQVGDILQFFLTTTKTGTIDSNTTRVYWNTSQSLSGATMIGMLTQAASNQWSSFTRKIRITGTTTQEFMNSALSGNPSDDLVSNSAQSTAAFNIANDIHFCTAVDLSGTPTDTIVLRGLLVILYR